MPRGRTMRSRIAWAPPRASGVPGLIAGLRERTLALTGGEGVFEALERRIDVHRRVAALAHREAGVADRVGRDQRRAARLGGVRAAGVFEEVLDLVDVVAEARLAGAREGRTHAGNRTGAALSG